MRPELQRRLCAHSQRCRLCRRLAEAGLAGAHFDLRHTGNTLTAATGASLRELMERTGHNSPRAALTYLHGDDARLRAIADGLSKLVEREFRSVQGRPNRARRRGRARRGHANDGRASRRGTLSMFAGGLTWGGTWWGYQDLNLGPLPYQGSPLVRQPHFTV